MTAEYQLLKEAFLAKKGVKFHYKGHWREVEIYQLGWSGGGERCYGKQYGGSSSSGDLPGERCFHVELMSQLELSPNNPPPSSLEEVEEAALLACIAEPDPSLKC